MSAGRLDRSGHRIRLTNRSTAQRHFGPAFPPTLRPGGNKKGRGSLPEREKGIASIRVVGVPKQHPAATARSGNGAAEIRSSPHAAHASLHIDGRTNRMRRGTARLRAGPVPAPEMLGQAIRDKARSLRIDVTVTEAALAMREESLRHHEMNWSFARVMAT